MDTDRALKRSVNAPGWKWIPSDGAYLWWDGQRYTARAVWDGSQWQVISGPQTRQRELPSRGSVTTLLALAVLTLAATVAWGIWGNSEIERSCESDLETCVNDGSMAVYSMVLIGLGTAFLALLVLGVGGLFRRYRARHTPDAPAPVIDQTETPTPL